MTRPARPARRARVAVVLACLLVAAPRAASAQDDAAPAAAPKRTLTRPPTLTSPVSPVYPPDKLEARVASSVLLTLELDVDGRVRNVTVAESGGEDFDAAAVEAARALVFEPAEIDGKRAAVKIAYRYEFTPPEPEPAPEHVVPLAPPPPGAREAPRAPADDVEEVRVRAPRPTRNPIGVLVSVDEARRVPGTQGDALKVVENLPGVARASFGSGQLVVWGSAPRDTRVYVDGVEIPALYHGSGVRSTFNAALVRAIDFAPGAFGADYGRGLGGIVRVETKALPETGVQGYVGADLLDASAMVSAAPSDRFRVAIAARQSYVDRILEGAVAPDVGDFFSIPRYRDYQAKATLVTGRDAEVSAVFLGSDDELRRTLPSRDPARVRTESTRSTFHRGYVRFTRTLADGSLVTATPFVGYDTSSLTSAFGATPASLALETIRYGARAGHRLHLADPLTLAYGLDALGSASRVRRTGSLNRPPREGDIAVFGQPPGDDVSHDSFTVHLLELAPYVTADVKLGPLVVTPGLRANVLLVEGSRASPPLGASPPVGHSKLEGGLDPRLSARWELSRAVSVTASAGFYRQAPEPEDTSAVFGTPELGYARARHLTVGAAWKITPKTTGEITGFYKTLEDLHVRSRLPTPRLARALIADGQGRSMGVQVLVRQELWRGFFGWASYTLSRSQRRYYGDEAYRFFDYDQPHVLSIVASQEIRTWVFGARFRLASGAPRTPVESSYYDPRGDQYQPLFGAHNSERLPTFYQLDLRIEKSFDIGRTKLSAYVDVQNVTARRNAEELLYSYDYRSRGVITGMPTLAVVGARLDF